MDELDAGAVRGKITLLPGYDASLSSVTLCIQDEDHTLGNALRYMLMKECIPLTSSIPHPSESKIHMRVQMNGSNVSAIDAVRDALDNLDNVFATIRERYNTSLESKSVSKESVAQPSVPMRPSST